MYHPGLGDWYEGGCVCGRTGCPWDSVLSAQFCCERKTVLKKKVNYFKKFKKWWWILNLTCCSGNLRFMQGGGLCCPLYSEVSSPLSSHSVSLIWLLADPGAPLFFDLKTSPFKRPAPPWYPIGGRGWPYLATTDCGLPRVAAVVDRLRSYDGLSYSGPNSGS